MEDYETVLLVKQEVFVYRIPPRTTNRGYRAADWKLDVPDWTGRMRVVTKGKECIIKLEDKITGELFSESPIDKYPGVAVEAVMDSSRYFVLRIQDSSGRAAFIGIGFADRGDSFDLNVALQEHFKWLQKSEELEQGTEVDSKQNLDLSFKAGETITINMNIGKKSSSSKPRPKPASSGGIPGLLPPPPSGTKVSSASGHRAPVQASSEMQPTTNVKKDISSNNDLLLDFGLGHATNSVSSLSTSAMQNAPANDQWGDFATANTNSAQSTNSVPTNWMDF